MRKRAQIILPSGRALTGAQCADELDLADYLPLCHKLTHRWRWLFDDHAEGVQVAMIGLIKARDRWVPQRGPFGSIAKFYVIDEFKMEAHRRQVRAHLNLPAVIVVEGVERDRCELLADAAPSAEEILINRDEVATRTAGVAQALAVLNEKAHFVIQELFLNDPPTPTAELATVLKVSVARVQQIKAKALQRMRATLNGEPLPVMGRPKKERPPPAPVVPRTLATQPPPSPAELAAITAAHLARLTPLQRQVFDARFVDGVGQSELAAQLGLSRATVRHQQWLALKAVRSMGDTPGKQPASKPQPVKVVIPAPKPPRRAVVAPAVAFA